ATNSPLTAVATTAPASPSSSRRAESSPAAVSRQAPLRRIFIHQLRKMSALEEYGRRAPGERGSDQEAVTVEAVHIERAVPAAQPREIIGESRAHAGADLGDLSLPESRMQGVGRRQELQHRARADARVLIALDHGRAHHEETLGARHHVYGDPRV